MRAFLSIFFTFLILGCNFTKDNFNTISTTVSDTYFSDRNSVDKQNIQKNSPEIIETHLQDTMFISGNYVLFLRPDSLRFQWHADNPNSGIYEADSDFGYGISATIDSISAMKKYKGIKTSVSENRYIVIKDCKNSPLTIDRDTIDYGAIFTSKGKVIKIITSIHSTHYLDNVNEYFNLK